jgi:protease-4
MKIFLKAYLASILAGLTFVFLLFLTLLLIPKEEKISIRKNSILHLSLDNEILERSSEDPFGGVNWMTFSTDKALGLNTLLKAIKHAKDDEKIKGIFIEMGGVSAGFSTLKELRNALEEFKTSEKFIWTYADIYTQSDYYLASVADSVFFNPSGFFDWHGLASNQPYLKNMFDKIGVKPVVIRGTNNKFKSAVEPFLSNEMSPENREQLSVLLGDIWEDIKADVAKSRKMSPDSVQSIANHMKGFLPSNALALGLVDALAFRSDLYERLQEITEAKTLRTIPLVSPGRYARSIKPDESKDKIAVIYAQGDIGMGEGDDGSIGPESYVKAIRKAIEDEDVKAIVLRVNSPGGSALGSDIIHNELLKAKEKKPLIISMGDLAASGGYFISAPGDVIVAQPNTITGSIGVFMLYFTAQELLEEKVGITFHSVKTAEMADMGSPNRDLTEAEYLVFQKGVDDTYGKFISKVKNGRNLDSLYIDSIGQGRIWTGQRAKELGLVDELGGLDVALRIAAEKAGIENYDIMELPKQQNSFEKLMSSFGEEEIKNRILKQEFGPYYKQYQKAQKLMQYPGMMARMPVDIEIR